MINKRAEIICSYLQMNNKDDEYKLVITNFISEGFKITKNEQKFFEYNNSLIMIFYVNELVFIEKRYYKNLEIYYIDTLKILRDYRDRLKRIFLNSNKNKFIQYNLNKNYLLFISPSNLYFSVLDVNYQINIIYINKLIYKLYNQHRRQNNLYLKSIRNSSLNRLKYNNCKIFIPNKHELLYYSNYFLIIS